MANDGWDPDSAASFDHRLGISPREPGSGRGGDETATKKDGPCPDIWELTNGDVAVIGRDLTESYRSRLPEGVSIASTERLVVIPRGMVIAAKKDIPDA
ncbi:MAG: hypothetical protein ACRDQ5_07160 [Sciscionella sp.]